MGVSEEAGPHRAPQSFSVFTSSRRSRNEKADNHSPRTVPGHAAAGMKGVFTVR
jgi:hypothetical protein